MIKIIVFLFAFQPVPTVPFLPSPTAIPSWTPQPNQQLEYGSVYNTLSTAVANVNALPNDIAAPGGSPLLPADNSSQVVFSYAKWMLSVGAAELLGTTLAPIATHTMIAVTVIVVLVTIWFIVNLTVLITRMVGWIINQVLKVIPFFSVIWLPLPAQTDPRLPPTHTPMPAPQPSVMSIPHVSFWDFADDTVAQWQGLDPNFTGAFQLAVLILLVMAAFLFIRKLVINLNRMEIEE